MFRVWYRVEVRTLVSLEIDCRATVTKVCVVQLHVWPSRQELCID